MIQQAKSQQEEQQQAEMLVHARLLKVNPRAGTFFENQACTVPGFVQLARLLLLVHTFLKSSSCRLNCIHSSCPVDAEPRGATLSHKRDKAWDLDFWHGVKTDLV